MPESIGSIFSTQIPSLTENANIQDALKIFHYGTKTVPTNISQLAPASVAGHLQAANVRLTALEQLGIGSVYSPNEPSSKADGAIWVDATSNAPIYENFFVAYYQESQPSAQENGLLWVNSVTKAIKVYDEADETWKTVASGSSSSAGAVNVVDLTGQSISIVGLDSATATGLGIAPIFGYQNSGALVPLAPAITTTKDNSKVEVSFVFGKALQSAQGNIGLRRFINSGQSPTLLGSFYFDGASVPQIHYIDSVTVPEGSLLTYVLENLSSETITFDGQSASYTIQAVAKEIA
jgi:hypothetical protein